MANPPISIGELADVPAPGSPIASAWAQEVSKRAIHRFATKAALDGWAAEVGSFAVVTSTGSLFQRGGGGWMLQNSALYSTQLLSGRIGTFGGGATAQALGGIVLPAVPNAQVLIIDVRYLITEQFTNAGGLWEWLLALNGAGVDGERFGQVDSQQRTVKLTKTVTVAAATAANITVSVNVPANAVCDGVADGRYNALTVFTTHLGSPT